MPPALNFAPIENASTALTAAAGRYKKALAAASSQLAGNTAVIRAVNAKLMQSERQLLDPTGLPHREWYRHLVNERQLLDPAGLPHREWYRHLLYAPGYYTGYDVKTLPGVREGIEQKQYDGVDAEIARAAKALAREAALVDAAAVELGRLAVPIR